MTRLWIIVGVFASIVAPVIVFATLIVGAIGSYLSPHKGK